MQFVFCIRKSVLQLQDAFGLLVLKIAAIVKEMLLIELKIVLPRHDLRHKIRTVSGIKHKPFLLKRNLHALILCCVRH